MVVRRVQNDLRMDEESRLTTMKTPSPQLIAKHAITDILCAMLKQDDAPMSAEAHLSQAVLILNQLACLDEIDDRILNEKLNYCRQLALKKYRR